MGVFRDYNIYFVMLLFLPGFGCEGVNRLMRTRAVYGTDDRVDLYLVQNESIRKLARSSVALFRYSDGVFDHQSLQLKERSTLGGDRKLCKDENERFFSQINPANCSGFLVSQDLIVTAGHCVPDQKACDDTFILFDYNMVDANLVKLQYQPGEVFACDEIVKGFNDGGPTPRYNEADIAVFKLKRKVQGRPPLKIRRKGMVDKNTALFMIGHPLGLPAKVVTNGTVREIPDRNHPFHFVTALDSFAGNSGSPVFNADTLLIEGIMTMGELDFIQDETQGCYRTYKCTETACRGEDVTAIANALPFLPNPPRQLILSKVGFVNPDGINNPTIAANQSYDLTFTMRNIGSQPIHKGVLTFENPSGGLAFSPNQLNISQFASGQQQIISGIKVKPSRQTTCGTKITIKVTATYSGSSVDALISDQFLIRTVYGVEREKRLAFDNTKGTIPDGTKSGLRLPLIVPPQAYAFHAFQIPLSIHHDFVEDLIVRLIAPNQQRVTLFDGMVEFDGANLIGIFGQDMKPTQPMQQITTRNPGGTWFLEVTDENAGDIGTLDYWGIQGLYYTCQPGDGELL